MKVNVGDVVTVVWSNGHGESVYQVAESFGGPATFELLSETEYGSGVDDLTLKNHAERYGDDDGMDDDDVKAVMRDIQARRLAQGVIV